MVVAFNNMPGDLRAPLFYAEFNAGIPAYSGLSRSIVLGRRSTGSLLQALKPRNVGGTDPNALGGRGSMLAEMLLYARRHNPTGELWVMDVGDPTGGAAATGAITVAGPATASGTVVVYLGGERYSVGVANGDSAATIAAALVATIGRGYVKFGRRMNAPVTAAVDGTTPGKVNLTAVHTGTEGNGFRIERGLDGDEIDPAGVTVTVTAMSGGAGDVDMAAALAALGSTQFDWVISPYAAASQLNAARDHFSDAGGTWGPTVGLGGHYLTILNGNVSALTTLGATRNDRHCTILGVLNHPTPLWSIVAALGGVVGFSKNLGRSLTEAIEIARPLQTIVLQGVRPAADLGDRFDLADRETLYHNGISGLTVNADGSVAIDRLFTTYQLNAYGQPDNTFISVESIAISAYVGRYMALKITSTYPRHVLRSDNPRGLQGVVTPDQARTTIIHAYTELSEVGGVVENVELFAQYLIVERSADPNRLNAYLPIDVANQLNVFASNITVNQELTAANAAQL
ncbi:phage tail sheath C-terminal domain-containing protein [Methylobacterium frigidaeris]|uniref:Phage tail protein n=1 Tax=Methylobacterium frigidaeris TaxID=2038277 RepID=A0AA37HG77_9HYPH|nr:phage tail sheath C-terminal domain-containing protein [Methylobacterium frigidaeris]PIK74819.1 hypothetical protein CS379_00535 [Methylobacterium frigidaeris]GJD65173.1 hypothetical protein MPEAHAMD_5360 [Methylobacterium frigidaeris]